MSDINKLLGLTGKSGKPEEYEKNLEATETKNPLDALKNVMGSAPETTALDKIANQQITIDEPEQPVDLESAGIEPIKTFVFDDQPDKYPADVLEDIEQSIRILQGSFENPELVGNAINSLVGKIQEHDFLKDILAPEAMGLMVRGLRESYGITIRKKSKTQKKREQRIKDQAEVDELLKNFDLDL